MRLLFSKKNSSYISVIGLLLKLSSFPFFERLSFSLHAYCSAEIIDTR